MGDSHNDALRVDFDRKIKREFHGSTVTSDAGLLVYRELDDALGLTSTAASGLDDTRTGQNTQHLGGVAAAVDLQPRRARTRSASRTSSDSSRASGKEIATTTSSSGRPKVAGGRRDVLG